MTLIFVNLHTRRLNGTQLLISPKSNAVLPSTRDPAPWNNTGGTGGVPVRSHIGIVKDALPTVIAGETLTYTLHVTNEGPDDSSNVIVGDTLPPNVGLISVTTTQGSCYASNPILCFLGALRVGESADVRITVSVPSSLPADVILSNTAFGFGGLDPLPWPGYGHVNTRVTGAADLELEKTIDPDSVIAGKEMTYFLKLKNKGPSDSTGMTISDQLPPEVRFRRVTPSQGSCSTIESGSTTITCAPGTIAAGSFATVAITVFVTSFIEAGVTISNRACVVGQKNDPISTNDCSSARALSLLTDQTLRLRKPYRQDQSSPVRMSNTRLKSITKAHRMPAV